MRKIGVVVKILIFVLLCAGAIGAVAYFTHGSFDFKDISFGPKSAGMYCNNVKLAADDTLDMSSGVAMISSEEAFDIKIVANPECKFDFYLDGLLAGFTDCDNFMPAFYATIADNSIKLSPPYSMYQALVKVYPEQTITEIQTTIDIEKSYFIAIISAANGNTYNIYLNGAVCFIDGGLVIDLPEVIF